MTATAAQDLTRRAAAAWVRLRHARPRVHALANTVAQPITANVLLAAGADVSLAMHPAEISDFARGAGALLINLGTLDADREAAIPAVLAARRPDQPLVLDPVFAQLSPLRLRLAADILSVGGVFVRANRAEIDALEAKAAPALAGVAARVVTGAVDEITDRTGRRIAIANGHLDMTRVTGIGCAAGALVAACAAVEPDPAVAATAALLAITIAGELAGARTAGPGTFAASLIDALAGLDAATLLKHARISIDFPS